MIGWRKSFQKQIGEGFNVRVTFHGTLDLGLSFFVTFLPSVAIS